MESLAAKRGADPDTLFTTPEELIGEVEKIQEEEQIIEPPVAEDIVMPPDIEEQKPESEVEEEESPLEMSEEETFAWMESLAAGRGADPETLLTTPEERPETQPDQVSPDQVSHDEPERPVEDKPGDEASVPAVAAEEVHTKILSEEDLEPSTDTAETQEDSSTTIPDWMQEEAIPIESGQPQDTTVPAWVHETDIGEEDTTTPMDDSDESFESIPSLEETEHPDDIIIEEIIETESSDSDSVSTLDETISTATVEEPEQQIEMPTSEDDLQPVMTDEISADLSDSLQKAQNLLEGGQITEALTEYNELIKSKENLEQVIADLQQALETHPVNPEIWGTLGYAYQYSDRIRDALEAYTKAEELLR
jgi:hypothetical protein